MRTQKTIVLAAMLLIVSMALTPAFAQATVQAESIGSQSAQINTEDTIITDAELETVEEEFNDPGMLPNHPFYGFKRFGESLSDVFTFDKIAKAKMHLERAKIRLAEAKALIELKEQELADKALQENQEELNKTEKERTELKALGRNISELVKQTDDVLQKSILILEMVKEKLPENAQEKLELVIKKQIEKKVRVYKANATTDDIEDEEVVQNKIRLSMRERLEVRFEKRIEDIEVQIEKAKAENDTKKLAQLTNLKEKTEELREKSIERIDNLQKNIEEKKEQIIERIDGKIVKAELEVKVEGTLNAEAKTALDSLVQELRTRDATIKIEIETKDSKTEVEIKGTLTEAETAKLNTLKELLQGDLKIEIEKDLEEIERLQEMKERIGTRTEIKIRAISGVSA